MPYINFLFKKTGLVYRKETVCALGTSEEEGSLETIIIYIIGTYLYMNSLIKCRRDQVSGICRTHGRDENFIQISVG
jgi:hypothetical protein